MKVADKGYPRSQLKGSWAGAFGNPQFLPSVYLRLATDGDGDGRANIFSNSADTLASIANYFRDAGWRSGQPWGVRTSVPQRPLGDDVMASLFQPDGAGTPAWLLTTNYRVILEYNCSNYYAMSVGLLADEIVQ